MSETTPVTLVQIAVAAGEHTSKPDIIYGLASDGSVWRLAVRLDHNWQKLPQLTVPVTAR